MTPGIVTVRSISGRVKVKDVDIDLTFINMHTFGTNVLRGANIFLLYISAHISYPPSMHRFLQRYDDIKVKRSLGRKHTHLSAPAASIQTSSSLSDNRVMSAPTTFFPCSNRRVDGSFCMRLDTATHAHLRSAASGLSNYSANMNSLFFFSPTYINLVL